MRTIVEPKEHICKLWGKQPIQDEKSYRMMRYVLRVQHDGRTLLQNVVTGQLVVLEDLEAQAIDKLPNAYTSVLEQLVMNHYLVPEDYDEHKQVINLRQVLWKLDALYGPKDVTNYTILPTTACNARCYYCFEQGAKPVTMTDKTADDVVNYIVDNCGNKRKVYITWFGGEPTLASRQIEHISDGLRRHSVEYRSKMITNGYLFDEKMVAQAKSSWHVEKVQICVDGVEDSYNRTKAYVNVLESPYQRVMKNIGLLLQNGIGVGLRMNYDISNYKEFKSLLDEVIDRFGHHELLIVGAHPVIGEYPDHDGVILHGSDEWFTDREVELNELASKYGLLRIEKALPSLNYEVCGACRDSMAVITPEGGIVRCPEQFAKDQFTGHVTTGVVNHELVQSWKQIADYQMCVECRMFPCCVRLTNCSNTTYCYKTKETIMIHERTMRSRYDAYLTEQFQ